jgi:hypothetical protein
MRRPPPRAAAGPRKRGEGCDDDFQGIIAAEMTATGGARLCITLLAAGFIIGAPRRARRAARPPAAPARSRPPSHAPLGAGPGGSSVRALSTHTGADIRSWSGTCSDGARERRVRTLLIEVRPAPAPRPPSPPRPAHSALKKSPQNHPHVLHVCCAAGPPPQRGRCPGGAL